MNNDHGTHTPGPWRVTQGRHHSQAIEEWWIDSSTRKAMACLQVWDVNHNPKWRKEHPEAVKEWRATKKEVAANARLIASAPQLLEALERLIDQIQNGIPFKGDTSDMGRASVETARAAIAKAKGETRGHSGLLKP